MARILRACADDLKYGGASADAVVGYFASGPYGLTIVLGTAFSVYNFTKGAEQCQLGTNKGIIGIKALDKKFCGRQVNRRSN